MRFIKAERAALEAELVGRIKAGLQKGDVALLVPGGSNIASVVKVLDGLGSMELKQLTLILSDERFGPIGHPDSNYYQMQQAGLNLRDARFVETLVGSDLATTVKYYAEAAEKLLSHATTVIAFLGMGSDGHIAGILPGTPAAKATDTWATGYETDNFTRITLTAKALAAVDVAIVGAYGEEKLSALQKLRDENIADNEQPAQILKRLPEVLVFNDQIQAAS